VAIVLWALGFTVAIGETETKPPADTGPELYLHSQLDSSYEEFDRDFAADMDQLAEEQYEKRGAEITLWIKDVALPSPDNAALLYYQAFLLRPEPNMSTFLQMDKVLKGAEPNRQIKIYLGHCLKMIHIAELASQIPQCTWGIRYFDGPGFNSSDLGMEVRRLSFILAVDARTLAADGHYRAAFDRCLTIRRLAAHFGNNTPFRYGASVGFDTIALHCIRDVLGSMPPDANTLTWLQGQLAFVRGTTCLPSRALEMDFEFVLRDMQTNIKTLTRARDHLAEKAGDRCAKKEIQDLTDEESLARARESYVRFLNSVLRVIGSEMPYEKTCAEIKRLTDELREKARSDPVMILSLCAETVGRFYNGKVSHTAYFNAIRAAIEIYLAMAKTGQLPETPPEYLPKDPFSGEDFEYETTKKGFVLRCRVKPTRQRKVQQHEFKVQR